MKEHELDFEKGHREHSLKAVCSCGIWSGNWGLQDEPEKSIKKRAKQAHDRHVDFMESEPLYDRFLSDLKMVGITHQYDEMKLWYRAGKPTADSFLLERYQITFSEAVAKKEEEVKTKQAEKVEKAVKEGKPVPTDKPAKFKNKEAKFRLNKIGDELSKGNETIFCHAWYGLPKHTGTLNDIKEVYFIANENARNSSVPWFVGRAIARGEAEELS